ncbi:B4GN4 acetylgalactosaminyltransferase, partial [Columbina picui]|nr:B4GN4 acetylgalactosaminyltransferase [Columbina picui]
QYKGKANLHVFEDWCGGAVRHLRKNLHFPLFPHTRTTVKKLAVSPKWKNYGLRIFGYIHPFKDGDFQFSVASDDNSEFWLSSDESPSNARLAAFVGKLLHKQDDRGSDHVEVGWRVFLPSLKFEVIDSSYISLYAGKGHAWPLRQARSLQIRSQEMRSWGTVRSPESPELLWGVDGAGDAGAVLRRCFLPAPAIEPSRVENVLVPCAYSPSYVVKDFPIARYQGLQFVYLSFVYPNDFTRLTHMETENKCFYRESPLYLEKFGFYKYMKMDEEEEDPRQRAFLFLGADSESPAAPHSVRASPGCWHGLSRRPARSPCSGTRLWGVPSRAVLVPEQPMCSAVAHPCGSALKPLAGSSLAGDQRWERLSRLGTQRRGLPGLLALGTEGLFSRETREDTTPAPGRTAATADYNSSEATRSEGLRVTSFLKVSETTASQQEEGKGPEEGEEEEVSDYSYEAGELQPGWREDSINWQRTFSVSSVDFELLRSDWNDLRCNVSGNLQLGESEVVDVVAQYMEKLNEKNGGIYTLLRIVNVEKRRDTARGNRYLLELELAERGQRTVRLSEYVYVLLHQGQRDDSAEANVEGPAPGATEPPPGTWGVLYGKPVLCQPLRLSWRQDVMVHFVVPVKNQARWVQQFISDMARLYGATKDANFNVILVDFDSDDMDVEKALRDARLPR